MRIACVGAGIIGSGWASLALANGMTVQIWDPSSSSLDRSIDNIKLGLEALKRLDIVSENALDRLHVSKSLELCVENAQIIHENAPEDLSLKKTLLHQIDNISELDSIIASSSSALKLSEIRSEAKRHPQRCVIAHPFNPVYLIPLVELISDQITDRHTIQKVQAYLEQLGKTVVSLRSQLSGYVGNRLQEALWREALSLVVQGEASIHDIETIVTKGLGPRWTTIGPFATYHLAYGENGISEFLNLHGGMHPGWSSQGIPEISGEVAKSITRDCERLIDGKSLDKAIRQRDIAIAKILKVVEPK